MCNSACRLGRFLTYTLEPMYAAPLIASGNREISEGEVNEAIHAGQLQSILN